MCCIVLFIIVILTIYIIFQYLPMRILFTSSSKNKSKQFCNLYLIYNTQLYVNVYPSIKLQKIKSLKIGALFGHLLVPCKYTWLKLIHFSSYLFIYLKFKFQDFVMFGCGCIKVWLTHLHIFLDIPKNKLINKKTTNSNRKIFCFVILFVNINIMLIYDTHTFLVTRANVLFN